MVSGGQIFTFCAFRHLDILKLTCTIRAYVTFTGTDKGIDWEENSNDTSLTSNSQATHRLVTTKSRGIYEDYRLNFPQQWKRRKQTSLDRSRMQRFFSLSEVVRWRSCKFREKREGSEEWVPLFCFHNKNGGRRWELELEPISTAIIDGSLSNHHGLCLLEERQDHGQCSVWFVFP